MSRWYREAAFGAPGLLGRLERRGFWDGWSAGASAPANTLHERVAVEPLQHLRVGEHT